MFNVIDFVGSLTFVSVTFRAPVMSVAPLENVIAYSLLATMWAATSNAQLPLIVKSEAGTNSRTGVSAPATGASGSIARMVVAAKTRSLCKPNPSFRSPAAEERVRACDPRFVTESSPPEETCQTPVPGGGKPEEF